MDADRFDALLRSLASGASRRTLTSLTIAGSLAALLGHVPDVAGKKRKKKKKCKGGTTKCNNACVDSQSDPAHCGGCNQPCASGATCRNGSCQTTGGCNPPCPTGSTCVNGSCQTSGACNPPCPSDRPCYKGACLCSSDGQCIRDRDPGGDWCVKPTDDPFKTHCGCSRGETVCAPGEACSFCCTTEFCRQILDDSFVCPSVPAGAYRGKTCCIANDRACSSDSPCCSGRCNRQGSAGTCACGVTGQACTYNTGCCSGTCSSVTRTCV